MAEAMHHADVSKSTMHRWCKSGKVISAMHDGCRMVDVPSLEMAMETRSHRIDDKEKPPAPTYTPGDAPDLDAALDLLKKSTLRLTKICNQKIIEEAEGLDVSNTIRNLQKVIAATGQLIEFAPFFSTKNQVEASEHFQQWVSASDIPARERETVLNAVFAYQNELLSDLPPG